MLLRSISTKRICVFNSTSGDARAPPASRRDADEAVPALCLSAALSQPVQNHTKNVTFRVRVKPTFVRRTHAHFTQPRDPFFLPNTETVSRRPRMPRLSLSLSFTLSHSKAVARKRPRLSPSSSVVFRRGQVRGEGASPQTGQTSPKLRTIASMAWKDASGLGLESV